MLSITSHFLLLRLLRFLRSPRGKSCPCPALLGLSLVSQGLGLGLFALHCVDGLEQYTLVLELVTLGTEVESVVDVLVNFLGIAHLVEETTKDADAAHPEHLEWETSVGGTTTLSHAFLVEGNHVLHQRRINGVNQENNIPERKSLKFLLL